MHLLLSLLLILFQLNDQEKITSKIVHLLKKSLPKNAEYSITCFSTLKNDYLIKINSDLPLIPASTNKIFTTGVALMSLGPNFTINTELYCDDSELSDGVINGNLYLKGYGDPTITTENIKNLVIKIKSLKINSITGNIIVDDSFFEETFNRNEWIENENISVVLPPISAITINHNSISLRVNGSNRIGKAGKIILDEELDYFQIINQTQTKINITIRSSLNSTKCCFNLNDFFKKFSRLI